MSISLALISALLWGLTDYLGGRAGRSTKSVTVTLNVQLIALVGLVPIVLLSHKHPTTKDLLLGAIAGTANAVGYTLFVEGASRFQMNIVVPVSAVAGAILSVIVGLLLGEHLNIASWSGIALALVGIWLISSSERKGRAPNASRLGGVEFGLLAGLCFGVIFTSLSRTSHASGLWPLLMMRTCIPLLLAYAIVKKAPLMAPARLFPMLVTLSVFAILATASYTVASRIGPLGVIAVLASMSPLWTIIIAHYLDSEVMTRKQLFGIAMSLVAVGLLAAA